MAHLLIFAAVAALVLYIGLTLLLWRYQERIVFQPPSWQAVEPALSLPSRQVHYVSSDGVALFAWVVGECAPGTTVLLAFHGNAEYARWLVPWATMIAREANACIVLPEYRGYDGLSGRPSYDGSAHDARAALAYVRDEMGASLTEVVFFGHSLGSAIAAELASAAPPRALVLQSPLSSARELSRRFVAPLVPGVWRLISRVHFDTTARVKNLDAPVWVAHGDHDVVIPVRMGRAVFAAARRKGELLVVRGAGHNDLAEAGGDAYREWLRRAVGARAANVSSAAPGETRSAP